jgi:membrane protease YdiL (CAAX protease family)
LAWLLWRAGSLRVVIFVHAFNNLLAVLVLRLIALPTP